MALGITLKSAREAAGMSISDLCAKTHMMTPVIEDLETENFKHIVAPIYGRGFVKLYCEAVGLKARTKELQDEFTALYRGKPVPKAAPAQTVAARTDVQDAPKKHVVPRPPSLHEEKPIAATPQAPHNPPRAPKLPKMPAMPKVDLNWRMIGLYAAVVVVAILIVLGLKGMYSAMKNRPAKANKVETQTAAETQPVGDATKAPRTPLKIEPLYID